MRVLVVFASAAYRNSVEFKSVLLFHIERQEIAKCVARIAYRDGKS